MKVGTNEVISTLLLSFIAVWMLYGSVQSTSLLRQPMTNSATLPESLEIPGAHAGASADRRARHAAARWARSRCSRSRSSSRCVLERSLFGLRLRAVGLNPLAARRAGMPIATTIVVAMFIAGAFAGLAGGFMLQGEQLALKARFPSGYGLDGLVVGLLARGTVKGVLASALLFGFLRSGGISMELVADVPSAIVLIIQGLVDPAARRQRVVARARGAALTWTAAALALIALFVGSSIRLAMPMLFGALGELVSERAGVLNLSIEGMMLTGAFAGAMGSLATGQPLLGLLIAVASVLPIALLQAWLSVTLHANQIVSGIGINILVLGGTTFAYRELLGNRSRVQIPGLDTWQPPGLGDLPVIGPALFQQSGLRLPRASRWRSWSRCVLRYTALGLAIHAAGAEPAALDKSGGSVRRVRYGAVVFAGVMSALGGAFLSLGDIHTFTEGMTNGAGYLALVGVIFGNWKTGAHGASPASSSAPRRRCSSNCRRSASTCRPRC